MIIQRAGDVIPKVLKVLLEKRSQDVKAFHVPTECPACGGPDFKGK